MTKCMTKIDPKSVRLTFVDRLDFLRDKTVPLLLIS